MGYVQMGCQPVHQQMGKANCFVFLLLQDNLLRNASHSSSLSFCQPQQGPLGLFLCLFSVHSYHNFILFFFQSSTSAVPSSVSFRPLVSYSFNCLSECMMYGFTSGSGFVSHSLQLSSNLVSGCCISLGQASGMSVGGRLSLLFQCSHSIFHQLPVW